MYLWVVERCIRKIFLKKAHVETWNKNIYTHTYRYIYTHTYRYIYVLHNEESYLVYCIKTLLYYSFRYFHNQEKKNSYWFRVYLVFCLIFLFLYLFLFFFILKGKYYTMAMSLYIWCFVGLDPQQNWLDSTCLLFRMLHVMNESYNINFLF